MARGAIYAQPGSGWRIAVQQMLAGPMIGPDFLRVPFIGINRTCSTCEKTKDLSQFAKDGLSASGEQRYKRRCRECLNKQLVMWKSHNRKAKRAKAKA
jgi:hypothetical protein